MHFFGLSCISFWWYTRGILFCELIFLSVGQIEGSPVKITTSSLKNLAPPGNQRRTFWDDDIPGFGITQHPGGKISYVAKYRIGSGANAKQTMKTLGRYPTLTPEQARKQFTEFRANASLGVDLAQTIRAEKKKAATVNDLCDTYVAGHMTRKRPSSQYEDQRKIDKRIRPIFGTMRIDEVAHKDIVKFHSSMQDIPIEANRTIALLSKMFALAVKSETAIKSPVKGNEKYPENTRRRYLSDEEEQRLDMVLDKFEKSHPEPVTMLRLLRLTGSRKHEIVGATWDQFDLTEGAGTKEAGYTKQKKYHRVPIAPEAVDLVKTLTGKQTASGDLFKLSPAGRMTALKRLWPKICDEAKLVDFHIHDLRHTFASVLASAGYSLQIIADRLLQDFYPCGSARRAGSKR